MQCRTFWCLISGWCSPMLDSRVGIGFVEACFDFVFEFEGASSCWCWCSGWVSSVAVTSSSSSSSPHTFPSTPSSSLEKWCFCYAYTLSIECHVWYSTCSGSSNGGGDGGEPCKGWSRPPLSQQLTKNRPLHRTLALAQQTGSKLGQELPDWSCYPDQLFRCT